MNAPSSMRNGKQLLLGALFGIAFGFLLQKGGVAHFDVLIGALLLEDFTVFKIMLTAIVVGMLGIFTMHRFGLVDLHPKPLKFGSNIIGGLVFGVGFGLSGYCPGTGAAAIGQGNYDALVTAIGLLVGSYVYAEMSRGVDRTVGTWGNRDKVMVTDLLRVPRMVVVASAALLMAAGLLVLALM